MMTKEQERQALEKIKKILAGLDEDGYVRTAMKGVIEDAEENIQNDWANSIYDAWQGAEDKLQGAKEELKEARQRQMESDAVKANMKDYIETLERELGEARIKAQNEVKLVEILTKDGEHRHEKFAEIRYIDNDGFRFINVVEESGWTTSYKIDDLEGLRIK